MCRLERLQRRFCHLLEMMGMQILMRPVQNVTVVIRGGRQQCVREGSSTFKEREAVVG